MLFAGIAVIIALMGLLLMGLVLAIVLFAASFTIKPLRRFGPHRHEKPT